MKKQIELVIPPEKIYDKTALYSYAAQKLQMEFTDLNSVVILKRSIDARSYNPVYRVLVDVYINEYPPEQNKTIEYKPVKGNKKVIVVGFGPAGMFASLKLIELGIKPIIIERGKDVRTRRRDLKAIQQFHQVNPDSNYCFGEGGAGTYSDGKLYTRSTKRGDVKKILQILYQHGAQSDILIDAHPHIGSNRLPKVVQSIRQTILNNGGSINFEARVTDFIIQNEKILGVIVNDNREFTADSVILSTGHSARDIFYLLNNKKIVIEPKPYAMGVRIEHPQQLINTIQYHKDEKDENLPAASYSLACNTGERAVYSFCMCPGGIIVPTATAPGELVVNGMSLSNRNSPFANSGFVTAVNEKDWKKYNEHYPFSGLMLQQELEKLAFHLGSQSQSAPAQRVTDFVNNKISTSLPDTSYIPGVVSAPLHEALPEFISSSLKKALLIFNKKMKGYFSEEAIILAVESRTSSPVRIPRDNETYMHPQVEALFPCGEGSGYAGGIVSAAVDGENSANAAANYLKNY